jgi:tetratricopeptide (TPR) repeat protein
MDASDLPSDLASELAKQILSGAGPARAELTTRLAEARQRGDRDAELDALIRLGALEVAADRGKDALEHLRVAQEHIDRGMGDALAAGRVHYIRGQALARTGGDPGPSFARAVERFRSAGARVDELRARLRIIELLQAAGHIDRAIGELSAMIDDLRQWNADRGLVDCHRHRAALHALMGRFEDCAADYDQAVAAAERLGDRDLVLRMRLERRALVPYAHRDAATWDSWQDLIAEAAALGNIGAMGDIHLQRAAVALQGDRFADGLVDAQVAQQAALDAGQPILYLMACLLMAEAREGLGDHAGVIEVLLTCKASLERAYGRELAAPVLVVLDSLEPRWGKARFDAALALYRAWARARSAREGKPPHGT